MDTAATTRTPSELARAAFHTIFDERDLSDTSAFWSDASVDHFLAAGRSVRGREALTAWFRDLFAAVPDWKLEIEEAFDDGDRRCVVRWHATGTFTGAPFLDIEATGRPLEIRGTDVIHFDADGRVAENTIYYDGAEFARQVGMLPRRDSALDRFTLGAFNAATRLRRRVGGAA